MNINNPKHPHHAIWREHVQSVLDDSENPKIVQYQTVDTLGGPYRWANTEYALSGVAKCVWGETGQYRIKPRTITRTITYPEPMRKEPEFGTICYAVTPRENYAFTWQDIPGDLKTLKAGMCFHTQEDAEAAHKALFGIGEI